MVDQQSQFRKSFAELSSLHDYTVAKTGSESHSSMGIGERYHAQLCSTYLKLGQENQNVDSDLILELTTRAMNDTLGPERCRTIRVSFRRFSILTFIPLY